MFVGVGCCVLFVCLTLHVARCECVLCILCVVRVLLFVVSRRCCLFVVPCASLFDIVCCLWLLVSCCLVLFGACCMLFVVCRSLFVVVRCRVSSLLFVLGCFDLICLLR